MINWNTVNSNRLIKVLMRIDTPDLMRSFLDDLMTESELEIYTKRLAAAYQLMLGVPYSHIEHSTGLSSATIARIAKQVDKNKSGYSQIFKKLHPDGSRTGVFLD